MTSEDIKYIIKCIRQDTISNIDKMHIEGLLLAELERVEWLKQFQPK